MGGRLTAVRSTSPIFAAAVFALAIALGGCAANKLKEPVALAKLPDLAYPVVLPPSETPPVTATGTVPQPSPEESSGKGVTKPRIRPRPKAAVPPEKPSAGNSVATTPQPVNPNVNITAGGNDTSAEISAGLSHTDEAHHRQTTAELIQLTENNLRSLDRQLTEAEQQQVDQIKNFVAQARSATADNDLVRAHNLALKAHLLSDELVRH